MKNLYRLLTIFMIFFLISCNTTSSSEMINGEGQSDTEEKLVTVTINNSAQINYGPIYFADVAGYFEEFGIELEVLTFNRVTESVPLLASGQMDVYAGSNTAGLINIFGQEPYVKAIANRGQIVKGDCSFQAILVRKDLFESGAVKGPENLEGLIIASNTSATRGFNLHTYLGQAGLSFDDVEISGIPSASYIDAFENKTIDAIVTPELNLTRVLQAGNAVVLSRTEDIIGPYLSSILAFGPRLIHDDPDLGVRFLAAYLKGVKQYNEGKTDENLELLAKKTGEDIELLNAACWMPIREDGWIDFSFVDPFQQWSFEMGQLDETISEEQYWDSSFLEAATSLLQDGE